MADAGITVIGAGVVGLAIAEYLAEDHSSVFVIDKHRSFGQETSSRNSEVIHAGIYYPKGSLKAKLCVEGREMLYRFCSKWDIPHKKCGKLIAATNESEKEIIESILQTAAANGVTDLRTAEPDEISVLEPNIFALKAAWSPSTGIIDSHSLMKQLEINFINKGGYTVYGSEVTRIKKTGKEYEVSVNEDDGNEYTFTSEIVINSAGLAADTVSEMTGLNSTELKIIFCKGEYFRLKPPKNKLINRLVYPVPHQNLEGVGIHVTIDMGGGVRLGPDIKWLDQKVYDYTVDPSKKEAFYRSALKFLPFLEPDDIYPEMAGIRPKIQVPGGPVRDFYIKEESGRGCPGFINLIGIESPGLTSCLAIAKYVKELII